MAVLEVRNLHAEFRLSTGTVRAVNGVNFVVEQGKIFGAYPRYEPGHYTFLADYLGYANGDGMEHRNSTSLTSSGALRNQQQRSGIIGTVAHEFFHTWNMERLRSAGVEPFDFEEADMSDDLWLVEDQGGSVVGYGLCWLEAPPSEVVADQVVAPTHRGRGLSELLLQLGEAGAMVPPRAAGAGGAGHPGVWAPGPEDRPSSWTGCEEPATSLGDQCDEAGLASSSLGSTSERNNHHDERPDRHRRRRRTRARGWHRGCRRVPPCDEHGLRFHLLRHLVAGRP